MLRALCRLVSDKGLSRAYERSNRPVLKLWKSTNEPQASEVRLSAS